jgi:energy-coupling factor transporter ATP-binding protein EcfA2
VVRTSSVRAFLAAARRLPTGAIGLAGPRGVGKTSLIQHFAGRVDDEAHGPVRVTVSAPVQYDPRDFVLHLFATVCQAVLRERRLTAFPFVRRLRSLGLFALATLVATVVALGFGVFGEPARIVREADLSLVPAGVFAVLLVLDATLLTRDFLRGRRRARHGIGGLAGAHLENIHYLQTHTSGWSGKVTLPRSEVGWSRSRQRERRPQTYPELVAALCDFLAAFAESTAVSPALIIAVDELDKIDSADRAQQFVNEIKSIFAAPGTQFLVSVSEDALASFERRGLPVRDAFDSAFHEIVRVDYLTVDDTAQLLSSRVIGLPEPFVWLVHCLSGGLPRDVVRTARAMVALTDHAEPPPSLDEVCAELVRDDLNRKSHAFQLACRDIDDSPEVTAFIRSLRQLPGDAAKLLGLVPALLRGGELASLSRQAAAYVYYSATLLEVFTRDRVDTVGGFDGLARAKQSLAVHPRLAWLLVDEFREAWGLATVPAD